MALIFNSQSSEYMCNCANLHPQIKILRFGKSSQQYGELWPWGGETHTAHVSINRDSWRKKNTKKILGTFFKHVVALTVTTTLSRSSKKMSSDMIDFEGNSSVPYFTIGGKKNWCVQFYRETNFAAAYNFCVSPAT